MIEQNKPYQANFTKKDLVEFRYWQRDFNQSKIEKFFNKFLRSPIGFALLLLLVPCSVQYILQIGEIAFEQGVWRIFNFNNLGNVTFSILVLSLTVYCSQVLMAKFFGKPSKKLPNKKGVAWGKRSIQFFQDHIELTTDLMKTTWDWHSFTSVSETKSLLILHSSPVKVVVFSKRDFSARELKVFLALKVRVEEPATD